REYLDRNHGSILILWDRLFGTFEPEADQVVYGLTTNIDTFSPLRIATHEWAGIARDVFRARTWRDRVSHLLRGPGWPAQQPAAYEAGPHGGSTACSARRIRGFRRPRRPRCVRRPRRTRCVRRPAPSAD